MPRRHALLGFAIATVWGANFVVIHVGLDSFPPLLFVALRFTVTALPLVFLIRRPPIDWRWILAVGTFLSAGQFAFLFVALDRGVPAGIASLVVQLQAVFTFAIGVVFLRERPRVGQVAGAALAVAGIGVIATGRSGDVPLLGLGLVICAAASWGVGNICTRLARAPDAFALTIWSSLVPPIPLALLSVIFEGPHAIGQAFAHLRPAGVLSLLFVVLAATIFGFGSWTWLLRRHEASRVAPFALFVPVAGIAAAWIALGERPNTAEFVGAALVLCGLSVAVWAVRPGARRPAAARAAEATT